MPVSIQACFHGSTGFVSTAASAIKWQAVPFLFTPLEPPPSHSERPAQLGAYPRETTTAFFFSFVTRPFKQGSHKVQSCGLQKTLLLPVSDSLSFRAKTAIPSFSTFFLGGLKGGGGNLGDRRETMTNAAKSRASNLAKGP